jgi:hypothetical protein
VERSFPQSAPQAGSGTSSRATGASGRVGYRVGPSQESGVGQV